MTPAVWAVVPAAGSGRRLPGEVPKQYRLLAGRSVIDHCLDRLLAHPAIVGVMVALAQDDPHWAESRHAGNTRVMSCVGGQERADSVYAALSALARMPAPPHDDDGVLVHDAARALLPAETLLRLLRQAPGEHGALLALPAQDTLKHSADGLASERTIDRASVWLAQTPQYFEFARLRRALDQALERGLVITDEASCMEQAGYRPRLVPGDALNFKITTPSDLKLAAALLEMV